MKLKHSIVTLITAMTEQTAGSELTQYPVPKVTTLYSTYHTGFHLKAPLETAKSEQVNIGWQSDLVLIGVFLFVLLFILFYCICVACLCARMWSHGTMREHMNGKYDLIALWLVNISCVVLSQAMNDVYQAFNFPALFLFNTVNHCCPQAFGHVKMLTLSITVGLRHAVGYI